MATRPFALITGASSGIGAAMARLAAARGCDVGVTARREDRLVALGREIEQQGDAKAYIFPQDLSIPGASQMLHEAVRTAGRDVDILVNNAGYSIPRRLIDVPLAQQRAFIELTVTAPVSLVHHCLPAMLEKGRGRIITISSITALSSGGKGHTLYPAGKAFLVKFSQSISAEYRDQGILSTAVLPGFVDTEFQQANGMGAKMAKGLTQRFAQSAEEIAATAWARNEKGAELVVPGLFAKAGAVCLRYLPERLMRAITRRAAEQYYIGE